MKVVFGSRKHRDAQSFVFFMLAWGTIMLLCGLAIDSGLLYLAKARLGRAVDGAALAAVGNFSRVGTITGGETQLEANRDAVAIIARNFAVANFTDLSSISTSGGPAGGTVNTFTLPNGTLGKTYTYNFNDGTADAHNWRRYIEVVLKTGSGGAITTATCNARCPVQTYFIGYGNYFLGGKVVNTGKIGGYSGPTGLADLKVSSTAVGSRNPRLIMVVIDRSASMLQPGGGASGLPPAVVQFLDFFDTSSDNIGIVSFGSSARLEMPMTTNFIIAGTNNLIDAYETNAQGDAEPGTDPESDSMRSDYDPNYATTGVRRLKFGGDTAADDGIRLAMEQLMANSGFNDPDVVKYMVIFTDGKWNASRTMVAAPGYTNEVAIPPLASVAATNFVTNAIATTNGISGMTNGQEYVVWTNGGVVTTNGAPWFSNVTTNMSPVNDGLLLVPTLSPLPGVTNAIALPGTNLYANLAPDHYQDTWLSADTSSHEPLGPSPGSAIGTTALITTNGEIGTNPTNSGIKYYTHNLDVWLQPGSVAYLYHTVGGVSSISNNGTAVYVSDYTKPTKHINLYVASGDKMDLVVPGYIADGVVFDGLDLTFPDASDFPRFRVDNYQLQDMWSDDTGGTDANGDYYTASLQRQLMFRNYANLLTGFYVFRSDEPIGGGFEPLITEDNPPGAPRSLYGLGAYYPSAGFYWPFGGETDANGYVTNAVGVDEDATFALRTPSGGGVRHIAYSINMLSTGAAPEWAGELFYKSMSGGGTNVTAGNGNTAVSQVMTSGDWQNGAPGFVSVMAGITGLMTNEPTHNTNIVGSPSVWRPLAFNGSVFGSESFSQVSPSGSQTGGWVSDGNGHYYPNTMAWSGRPTHYFDFSHSKWIPIADNHTTNVQFLQLGNWKAEEYAWHARALGIKIYTVGYGTLVTPAQQVFLAQIANSTNTTAGGGAGTNIPFNPSQPIGQQFYATNSADISNDFFQVGQAINAALTQ